MSSFGPEGLSTVSAGFASSAVIGTALALGTVTVQADDSTRVGLNAVNTYAEGVKQSIRIMTLVSANNPAGALLDANTAQLKQSAVETCQSNWQSLTGMAISADPSVKALAALRISQLSMAAGDDPCAQP